MNKCAICGKTHDLFELTFAPDETEAGKTFTRYVCGSCWDVIAAIAARFTGSAGQEAAQ